MKHAMLGLAALALASAAHADDWDKIGSRQVAFIGDHDTIDGTGDGKFTAIKIEVDDGNVEMYDIKVTFGNGDPFSPDTRITFDESTRSRVIDLPGEARSIRKVEFWYRSKGKKGRATVTVYGKRAAGGGGGDDGKEPKWDKLGSRMVSFDAEKDTIEVGAVEGRFNAIRLDVDAGNLEMYNVKVTFGDGDTFSPDTRFEFKQGSMSRLIDLPGDARVIRKIEFWYRSELKKGRANIDVFGRRAAGGGEARPALKEPKDRYPGWEFLGARVVDFGADHDGIDCRGEGRFTAFQVEVENGDLEMFDIVVTFGNGDRESIKTRFTFSEDTRTRTIDLPGNKRFVKRIDFFYKSIKATKDGKATINVYGKR